MEFDPDYQAFTDKVNYLDIVVLGLINNMPTSKVHKISYHISQFGLWRGGFSEKTSESIHCNFKNTFLKSKKGVQP